MTDRELDEKMADLCDKVLVESSAMGGRWLLVDPPGGCLTVWNPVDNWQQVHEFVIPAMNNLGLDVKLVMLSGWANRSSVWRDDQILRAASEGNDDSHCRVTCLAVLDAWEKLEARV